MYEEPSEEENPSSYELYAAEVRYHFAPDRRRMPQLI